MIKGRKKKRSVSLRSNSVEIEPLKLLINQTNGLPIYRMKIGNERFDLERTRVKNARDDKIELRFIKEIEEEQKKITMEAKLSLYVGHICFTIRALLWIKVSYEHNRYDMLMEDFLYTYFCSLIESSDMIQRRKEIHLPESLEIYYESKSAWRSYQLKDYVIIGFESGDTTVHRFKEPEIPSILTNKEEKTESIQCERIYG